MRIIAVCLAIASLSWIWLAIAMFGFGLSLDETPVQLMVMFAIIMLAPFAFLFLGIVVRKILRESKISDTERKSLEFLFRVLGPVGALFIVFKLTSEESSSDQ